jgi:hypothetical protein
VTASDSCPNSSNRNGNPDQHLLCDLQTLAKRAGAQFAVELDNLRKTGASRRYLAAAIRVSRSRRENTCAIIRIFLKAQYWIRKPVIGF